MKHKEESIAQQIEFENDIQADRQALLDRCHGMAGRRDECIAVGQQMNEKEEEVWCHGGKEETWPPNPRLGLQIWLWPLRVSVTQLNAGPGAELELNQMKILLGFCQLSALTIEGNLNESPPGHWCVSLWLAARRKDF